MSSNLGKFEFAIFLLDLGLRLFEYLLIELFDSVGRSLPFELDIISDFFRKMVPLELGSIRIHVLCFDDLPVARSELSDNECHDVHFDFSKCGPYKP